jgi:hypothetical protein
MTNSSQLEELRRIADELLTQARDTSDGREWRKIHRQAIAADKRYWKAVHGAACQCYFCKG